MLCISAAYAVMRCMSVCPCVCLSRSWVASKRIKMSSKFFHHRVATSHIILVFPYQTWWRYSNGNPSNVGVECRWGRQKTRFWTNIWLRCIQVYSVINRTSRELWKTNPRRTAASVEARAHRDIRRPLFAQDDDEVFVTGSTLYAGEEVNRGVATGAISVYIPPNQ